MASHSWCSAKFTMILLITALSFLALSSMMPTATASPEKMMEFFGEANKFASEFAKAIDSTFSAYFGGSSFPKKCYPANAIRLHNWGGNFMFDTQNIQYPRTVAEVQQIVRGACKLRVLGSRHSYSEVANSDDTLLSTLGMNSVISFNATVPSVTVQGGITYTDLTPALYVAGYALSNTVALAEVTVAGATQTGSHGSGVSLSSLPTQVRSMQLVLANGTVANFGPGSPELKALACGLGAFGVITQLELKLEPTYNTTSYVFLNMPAANLYANFDAINRMGYNVNMVTFMANTSVWSQVTITTRAGTAQNAAVGNMTSLFGATRSFAISAPTIVEINKEQPWYQGLLNFRLGTSGTDGNEIQTEYFVPYANAVPAIKAMGKLLPTVRTLATVHLIRTIAGDDLWMSEMYGNGTKVAIHFTWQNNMTALVPLLGQVEAALEPFGAIPHWGKFHTMSAKKFLKYYPKLSQFKQLARQLDPTGKFRNKYLDENVFARV